MASKSGNPAMKTSKMVAAKPAAHTVPTGRRVSKCRIAPKRNAAATRENILAAGIAEFCAHGYNGARTERIAKQAGANIRMIYHYFGNKEDLYLAVLERVYQRVRSQEEKLSLRDQAPVEGMVRLIDFTFWHLAENPEFIGLVSNENLLEGRYLKRSQAVPQMTPPLVEAIRDLLVRGEHAGVFRAGVDPVQLYITVLSLCYIHISNRFTLSVMFQTDLTDTAWLDRRRRHAQDVIIAYLRPVSE
ncbi:MAG: TetR/AcrR family transcriptional regulator [Alphaproteobacteria bacterium]|nr:TetR/AcrR family transcriptional regulator [Alphaproteobacteria bacterium]